MEHGLMIKKNINVILGDTSVRFERPSNSEILYQSANRCPSRPRDANSPMPPKHETPVKPATPDIEPVAPRPSRSATPLRTVTPVIAVKHVSGGEPVSQRTARVCRCIDAYFFNFYLTICFFI
jgi:hypothetical protein